MGFTKYSFPDTPFLPERAELALNCLTRALDRNNRSVPYCLMDLTGDPPKMIHSAWDENDHTARVLDSIQLARLMSGSQLGSQEECQLKANFESHFGEDGLHYTPDGSRTFLHANMHYQRSVLLYLVEAYLISREQRIKSRIEQLCQALRKISVKGMGFWYFPAAEYFPTGWRDGDWRTLGWGADPAHTNGRLIAPLVRYYAASRSEVALELADQFSRHVVDHSGAYHYDGSFNLGLEFREGHFHSRAVTMVGVLEYALHTSNSRLLEWGRRVFDFAQSRGTAFGWFPERLVEEKGHGCETCAITDMVQSAIVLGKAGYSSYWDNAERYMRNQLLENQLTETDHLRPDRGLKDTNDTAYAMVAERCLGGFAGWAQPNDLISKAMHDWDLYMCCCAAGVRGLFVAWSNAVTEDVSGRIRVNLLFNRTTPWVNVRSHIPYEGKVEIEKKKERDVLVRIPAGISKLKVKVSVSGQSLPFQWLDNYIALIGLRSDQTAIVEFPLETVTRVERVWSQDFTGRWKGDTVIGISPAGELVPLYNRNRYQGECAPQRTFSVFEPDAGGMAH